MKCDVKHVTCVVAYNALQRRLKTIISFFSPIRLEMLVRRHNLLLKVVLFIRALHSDA